MVYATYEEKDNPFFIFNPDEYKLCSSHCWCLPNSFFPKSPPGSWVDLQLLRHISWTEMLSLRIGKGGQDFMEVIISFCEEEFTIRHKIYD